MLTEITKYKIRLVQPVCLKAIRKATMTIECLTATAIAMHKALNKNLRRTPPVSITQAIKMNKRQIVST